MIKRLFQKKCHEFWDKKFCVKNCQNISTLVLCNCKHCKNADIHTITTSHKRHGQMCKCVQFESAMNANLDT